MNKKVRGYLMTFTGFIFLLFNALGYILDWESRNAAFTVLGVVFVTVGLKLARTP